MCGLAGWLYTPANAPDRALLRSMAASIAHRGPDDEGFFEDPTAGIAFAHRRLSIIDLSDASHQPMIDRATGAVLAYNGELYNFRDVRRELEALGHQFSSRGDTEVVLRAYVEWGVSCFSRFAGMFAIALWDPRSATLHLARDATGMKPLYFTQLDHGVAFASEVKAFARLPKFKSELDTVSVEQFLEFGYVFDDLRTMLDGVHKIAPGTRMELRNGTVLLAESFYEPSGFLSSDEPGEALRTEALYRTLTGVVKEHLIADVPCGLLLSGGLDSSLLAAMAAKHGELRTVSMGFAASKIDERPRAAAVAKFLGTRHSEVLISSDDVIAEVRSGAWVFDDLFGDWGTITTRILYRRCRELGLKVVLVGEGADELFGGYSEVFDRPPALGLLQQFQLYRQYSGRRYGGLFVEFRKVIQEYLKLAGGDSFEAIRLFESRRQLPNQYVMKVDKASMAESIEARAPFLDRRVAEIAYQTPRKWLLRGGENKYLLRAVARQYGLLPPETASQAKFGAPLASAWMDESSSMRKFAQERILDGPQVQRFGLRPAMVEYFCKGRSGYGLPHSLSIFRNIAWRLLLLELWAPYYVGKSSAA